MTRSQKLALVGAAVLALLALGQTTDASRQMSHTVDEPTHIGSGLEWLERGTQKLHSENPPLGRIGAGLGAYLRGHRLGSRRTALKEGLDALYGVGDYERNLASARLATLPFLLATFLIVGVWAHRRVGALAVPIAIAALATVPPFLGHAALATTDIPFTAGFMALLLAFDLWLERPVLARAAFVGLGLGLAMSTKFSALLLVPAALLPMLLLARPWRHDAFRPSRLAPSILVLLLIAGGLLWASYRFAIGPFDDQDTARFTSICLPDEDGLARRAVTSLSQCSVPAPDASRGLLYLCAHGKKGHASYALGQQSERGFWFFYPLALALRTPLTLWALVLMAVPSLLAPGLRAGLAPLLAAVGALAAVMTSPINIGVRHILPVYPLLAITIGLGLAQGWKSRASWFRALAGLLLAAQAAISLGSHPHELAYFNRLAGSEPGEYLVDSDLDWGQDLVHLERFFADKPDATLHIAYFGNARLCERELPNLKWLKPHRPVSGWIAISEMYYRDHWKLTYSEPCQRDRPRTIKKPHPYRWLQGHEPVARAGRSIRIYRIP